MGYLEKNARVVNEINKGNRSGEIILAKHGPVHSSEKPWGLRTTVTSVGAFNSETSGGTLYIAHKKHPAPSPNAFVQELAVAEGIASDFPHLAPHLPDFLSWCEGNDGDWLGYLMDDFSEGGTKNVMSIDPDEGREKGLFPEELYDWIPGLHQGELSHMCFLVGKDNVLRMGDFDTVLYTMDPQERKKRFKIEEIEDNLREFTVFVAGEIT